MAWIRMIKESAAEGKLAQYYKRYREPSGHVDSILGIHSLNPPSLETHYRLCQVTAYFAFADRLAQGLGIELEAAPEEGRRG